MDPASGAVTILLAPWAQLGAIGAIVVGLGLIGWILWKKLEASRAETNLARAEHLADVKSFGEKYAEALLENSKSNAALAVAIDRIGDRIK
jgi:hypothetical protein